MPGGCGESMQDIIARRTAQEKRLLGMESGMDAVKKDLTEVQQLAVRTALTVNKASGVVNKLLLLAVLFLLGVGTEKAQAVVQLIKEIFTK